MSLDIQFLREIFFIVRNRAGEGWDNWNIQSSSLARILYVVKLKEDFGGERDYKKLLEGLSYEDIEASNIELNSQLKNELSKSDFFNTSEAGLVRYLRAFKGYNSMRGFVQFGQVKAISGITNNEDAQKGSPFIIPALDTLHEYTRVTYNHIPKFHTLQEIIKIKRKIGDRPASFFFERWIKGTLGKNELSDFIKKFGGEERRLGLDSLSNSEQNLIGNADHKIDSSPRSFLYHLAQQSTIFGALAKPCLLTVNPSLVMYNNWAKNKEGYGANVGVGKAISFLEYRERQPTLSECNLKPTLVENSFSVLRSCILIYRGDCFWSQPPLSSIHDQHTYFDRNSDSINYGIQLTENDPSLIDLQRNKMRDLANQLVFSNSLIVIGLRFVVWEGIEAAKAIISDYSEHKTGTLKEIAHFKYLCFNIETTVPISDEEMKSINSLSEINSDSGSVNFGIILVQKIFKNGSDEFIFKLVKKDHSFNMPKHSEAVLSFMVRNSSSFSTNWSSYR